MRRTLSAARMLTNRPPMLCYERRPTLRRLLSSPAAHHCRPILQILIHESLKRISSFNMQARPCGPNQLMGWPPAATHRSTSENNHSLLGLVCLMGMLGAHPCTLQAMANLVSAISRIAHELIDLPATAYLLAGFDIHASSLPPPYKVVELHSLYSSMLRCGYTPTYFVPAMGGTVGGGDGVNAGSTLAAGGAAQAGLRDLTNAARRGAVAAIPQPVFQSRAPAVQQQKQQHYLSTTNGGCAMGHAGHLPGPGQVPGSMGQVPLRQAQQAPAAPCMAQGPDYDAPSAVRSTAAVVVQAALHQQQLPQQHQLQMLLQAQGLRLATAPPPFPSPATAPPKPGWPALNLPPASACSQHADSTRAATIQGILDALQALKLQREQGTPRSASASPSTSCSGTSTRM